MNNERDPNLVCTATPIPPSDAEKAAIALVNERFSDAAIEARVKALQHKSEE